MLVIAPVSACAAAFFSAHCLFMYIFDPKNVYRVCNVPASLIVTRVLCVYVLRVYTLSNPVMIVT